MTYQKPQNLMSRFVAITFSRNTVHRLVGLMAASGVAFLGNDPANAALSVTPSSDADSMAAYLLSPGVTLVPGSATYSGGSLASGFFSGDDTIFGVPGTSGILLTTGLAVNALGPNNTTSASSDNGAPGSAYLSSLIGGLNTYDASVLSFKIKVPSKKALQWSYVMGSEEYNEFVNFTYSDVFAMSLDGANLALIPGTLIPVSINTVNNGNPFGSGTISNSLYYRNNSTSNPGGPCSPGPCPVDTQYDGLTTVLQAITPVLEPGVEYTLSFAIADAGDSSVDSGVFIPQASVNDVPGPLPLLGAGVAFGWSARLRRRIRMVRSDLV